MGKLPGWKGVHLNDDIPGLKHGQSFVMNLAEAPPGTHWVAGVMIRRVLFYYDSFGMVPPAELAGAYPGIVYNDTVTQPLDSSACGYFCMEFIRRMHKAADQKAAVAIYNRFISAFKNITAAPADSDANEAVIRKMTAKMAKRILEFRKK